jgi:hypothetical protein
MRFEVKFVVLVAVSLLCAQVASGQLARLADNIADLADAADSFLGFGKQASKAADMMHEVSWMKALATTPLWLLYELITLPFRVMYEFVVFPFRVLSSMWSFAELVGVMFILTIITSKVNPQSLILEIVSRFKSLNTRLRDTLYSELNPEPIKESSTVPESGIPSKSAEDISSSSSSSGEGAVHKSRYAGAASSSIPDAEIHKGITKGVSSPTTTTGGAPAVADVKTDSQLPGSEEAKEQFWVDNLLRRGLKLAKQYKFNGVLNTFRTPILFGLFGLSFVLSLGFLFRRSYRPALALGSLICTVYAFWPRVISSLLFFALRRVGDLGAAGLGFGMAKNLQYDPYKAHSS